MCPLPSAPKKRTNHHPLFQARIADGSSAMRSPVETSADVAFFSTPRERRKGIEIALWIFTEARYGERLDDVAVFLRPPDADTGTLARAFSRLDSRPFQLLEQFVDFTSQIRLVCVMALHPPPDAEIIQSPFGTVWVWCPVVGVIVTKVEGVLSAQSAGKLAETMRRLNTQFGRHEHFHDWEGMTNYDGEARAVMTRTALSMRNDYKSAHLLVRSKAVALGVKVASAVAPNLTSHLDRTTFESALTDSIARHR